MSKPKLVACNTHPHKDPKAPVVVLIPGVGCGSSFWAPALEHLCPHYTVVVFSNPGTCGAPMSKLFTVQELALDVLATLQNMGITKCHVIGHSMGGYIAQQLVTYRPDMINRLVLLSTSYGGRATDDDIASVLAHMLPIWPKQRKLVKANPYEAFKFAVGRHTPERNPEGYAAFVKNRTDPQIAEEVYAAHFFCAIKFSGLANVANIQAPALVVHGNDDNVVGIGGGRDLAARLPNARFIEKDCGHITPFEVPDIYPDILTFLGGGVVGTTPPKAEPLTAAELAEDARWQKKRLGNLSLTALFALSKGLPIGIKHLLKPITG